MFLAQFTNVPLTTTGQWMVGLIGVAGVAALGLYIVIAWRKAFGRVPPFGQEIKALDKSIRKQIYAVERAQNDKRTELETMLRREFKQWHDGNARRMIAMEDRLEEMQTDRQRKWDQLNHSITAVGESVAFICGRFETARKHGESKHGDTAFLKRPREESTAMNHTKPQL